MIKINKISLKILSENKDLGNSKLEFNIKGDNINYIILNTLRRTMFADIPIYAFNEFKFDKNSSIFHANYLKLRLTHMPVWGIENTIDYIDDLSNSNISNNLDIIEEQDDNTNDGDGVELNVERNLNLSNLKHFSMYVNAKNKTNDIITVTTLDAKFYYAEKQINSPYKIPIPLVKLQPNQEIAFSAITNVGTESNFAMYSAVNVVGYKEISPSEYDFFVESKGQITEKRVIKVAIINIIRRIENFIKLLNENKTPDDKLEGQIIVNNEDNTLGNLIARGLQLHPKVEFAGYNLPHPLAKKVIFHYKIKPKSNIKEIMNEVVNYYIEIYTLISDFFN